MYFLIEYNRETKELKQCTEYQDRKKAWKDRFDLEVKLLEIGEIWTEAVVFEADTKADLEHNHSRYFKSFKGISKLIQELKKEQKMRMNLISKLKNS